MRRWMAMLAFCSVATTASAAWYPELETGAVRIGVGQTVTVRVRAIWTGLWILPWTPWVFDSTNPSVARVEGRMDSSHPGEMRITGVSPGRASAFIHGWTHTDFYRVEVTVVCLPEEPVQPARARQTAKAGQPILLQAQTPIASRTTFAWYHGRIGDMSFPIGQSGPEIVYVTDDPGSHYAWVLASTPCSSSTAEFEIDAYRPKRRGARH